MVLHFSEEEQQKFSMKLWDLLKFQTGKYNGIDSTSISVEKAQDLLESLVYTLTLAAQTDGITAERLLQKDFREVVKRGQEILDQKRKDVYYCWTSLCLDAPKIQNVYYMDTMKELGAFFKRYEIYYDAHQIPCSIDYVLLNPISEEVKGISFIEEYIRRIRIENQLINNFDLETVIKIYQTVTEDYKEEYFNLCEPILTSAIGRILLGYEPFSLVIFENDILQLEKCFDGKGKDEIEKMLTKAVETLCIMIYSDESKAIYFSEVIRSLTIRIEAAVKTGCLGNIFIPD